MSRVSSAGSSVANWFRDRPDRPFIILFAHLCIVALYITHHAVSPIPFTDGHTKTLATSNAMPIVHGLSALGLAVAIIAHRWQGYAAALSLTVWGATTGTLFFASHQRMPPLSYWSFSLSLVITVASFLMLVNWCVLGGDEREAD